MNNLAVICIVFGCLIVFTRLPGVIAPETAKRFFLDNFFSSTLRIRLLGVSVVALGGFLVFMLRGEQQVLALILFYTGCFLVVFGAVVLLVFTGRFKKIFNAIVEHMSLMTLRLLSLLGLIVGVLLIYFGITI